MNSPSQLARVCLWERVRLKDVRSFKHKPFANYRFSFSPLKKKPLLRTINIFGLLSHLISPSMPWTLFFLCVKCQRNLSFSRSFFFFVWNLIEGIFSCIPDSRTIFHPHTHKYFFFYVAFLIFFFFLSLSSLCVLSCRPLIPHIYFIHFNAIILSHWIRKCVFHSPSLRRCFFSFLLLLQVHLCVCRFFFIFLFFFLFWVRSRAVSF